jgi:prepilin-type processing-associated H-X9-DG protein
MFALMDAQEMYLPENFVALAAQVPGWTHLGSGWSAQDRAYSGWFWRYAWPPGGTPVQHGKALNVAYCDAHVALVPANNLFNPTNTARNWNIDHMPHQEHWGQIP